MEVSEFVQSALDGFNVCLFSYGQTGSGKTHTMQGSGAGDMRGMIPRAMEQVSTGGYEPGRDCWCSCRFCGLSSHTWGLLFVSYVAYVSVIVSATWSPRFESGGGVGFTNPGYLLFRTQQCLSCGEKDAQEDS